MVEAMANGVEDKLIDNLSFRLQPGASYVVDRRSVTYHPQGVQYLHTWCWYEAHSYSAHRRGLDGPEHPPRSVQH